MKEDFLRFPQSSSLFRLLCQLDICLKKRNQSTYTLIIGDMMLDYIEDHDKFEADLKLIFRDLKSDLEVKIPFSIIDNNERQKYYGELQSILEKYLLLFTYVQEFLHSIKQSPNQDFLKDYCESYFKGGYTIRNDNGDVIIEDIARQFLLKIESDYDFHDLVSLIKKFSVHHKYLVLTSELLTERIQQTAPHMSNLEWNGKIPVPALGYIFSQMAAKGYFTMPTYHLEPNSREMGRIICSLFGIQPTEYHLKQFSRKSNVLSELKRKKFSFPNHTDIQ